MKERSDMRAFRYMLIPVFATTVFAYCLFAVLSFMGRHEVALYNFPIACACAFISAAINCRFARRERSIASVAVLNTVLIVAAGFFVFSAPNDIEGFWLLVIAAVCVMAPIIHGLLLVREPMKANTMLLYCELSIIGTIILLALQIGDMDVPALTNGLSIAALILNIFMLSVLRVSGPAKKPEGGRKSAERGAFLISLIVGTVFAAVIIAVLLLPASRGAVFAAGYATRDFFIVVGSGLDRFFRFLVSLIPPPPLPAEFLPAEADAAGLGGFEGEGIAEMDPRIGILVFLICAAVALVAAVALLIRFRRKKIGRLKNLVLMYEEEDGGGWPFMRGLLALPGRLKAWLQYRKCLMARHGTYEEAYIRITRHARRRGFRRGISETPRAFLGRLDAMAGAGTGPLLDTISAAVDSRLYSGRNPGYVSIDAAEAETLTRFLSAVRRLRAGKANLA